MHTVAEAEEFEGRLAGAVGVLNAAHGGLVDLAVELLERELWTGIGFRSPEHWLTIHAGLSYTRARQLVTIARRASELPQTIAAFKAGELTFEQAHVVAAHAPAHNDEEALTLARSCTVAQLRTCLGRYTFTDEAAPAASPKAEAQAPVDRAMAPPTLRMFNDGARFTLQFDSPTDVGALVESAIREVRDSMFHAGDPTVTDATAFVRLCEQSLDSVSDHARADRFRVYVHLDTDGGWLNGGGVNGSKRIPDSLLKKITCDGVLQPLWETEGTPVNVGRAHRVAPRHTKRLVADRDGRCRFPGCGATAWLEAHHRVHWVDGGPTDTSNLLMLCPFHHDAHHRGEYDIIGNADAPPGCADELRFIDSMGRSISPTRPKAPDGPLPQPDRRFTPPSGERFNPRAVSFRDPPPQTAA